MKATILDPCCGSRMMHFDRAKVHEDDHIGNWVIKCNNCEKALELEAEASIDYWIYAKEAQEPTND